jgi:hypothetical protein
MVIYSDTYNEPTCLDRWAHYTEVSSEVVVETSSETVVSDWGPAYDVPSGSK